MPLSNLDTRKFVEDTFYHYSTKENKWKFVEAGLSNKNALTGIEIS